MRKTDKQRDKMIREALTDACETALRDYAGFEWLTHHIHYEAFPQSLLITCVFSTNETLADANTEAFGKLIDRHLRAIDISLKDIGRHLQFDTEENCQRENNGNWKQRLSRH